MINNHFTATGIVFNSKKEIKPNRWKYTNSNEGCTEINNW